MDSKVVGSGQDTGKEYIVQQWKREHRLSFISIVIVLRIFFLFQNYSLGVKQRVKQICHFDEETTKKLIYEGWKKVFQKHINRPILSMPYRFKDVI